MPFVAENAYVVITASDSKAEESSSTIPVCLGDAGRSIPGLDAIQAFAAGPTGLAVYVRGIVHGAFNTIESVVEYADDDPAYVALTESEVERKARIKLRSSSGKISTISIPGIDPDDFDGKFLDQGATAIAPLLDALITGIGGVVPIDSEGDPFTEIIEARKVHISSLKR